LVVAALADFSAVVFAAAATSHAFWEASSSASRDAMRALAIAKASAAWQREKESQVENQKKISETGRRNNTVKKSLPSEARAVFRNSTHSVPKATNFFIKIYKRKI
jgi:hypothetical protein